MATEATLSPMQQYERRLAALDGLYDWSLRSDEEADALDWAIAALKGTLYEVERRQRFYDTRHFCRLCYAEIPQGTERLATGYPGVYHAACRHLCKAAGVGELPATRKAIERGTLTHEQPCTVETWLEPQPSCPFADGAPLPVIGTHRSAFEEPRR